MPLQGMTFGSSYFLSSLTRNQRPNDSAGEKYDMTGRVLIAFAPDEPALSADVRAYVIEEERK